MNNSKFKTQNSKLIPRAFTLVELMIVVSVLGILAAIVLPEFRNHQQQAKEAQAKANLKHLRNAIERYALDHNDTPPGYKDNNPAETPSAITVYRQLIVEGKYLNVFPKNPFNGYNGMKIFADTQELLIEADGTSGWLYKPSTRQLRLNWPGQDSEGRSFFDY